MVAGHVSKDSWSRCETPSMLYDTVRKPNAPQAPKAEPVQGKDTLESTESTQQRLKREIVNKLDNKGLELPHESYVAVVQVGKYVFLAIMLPVYLCCYGVPRWFMINAISPMFEGIKNQALSVGRYIVEMSKHVTDLMKGLLEQLIGDALRMSKERGKNLWRHVTNRFERIVKKISGFSNSVKSRLDKIKGKIGYGSKRVLERAHYQSKSTNEWIANRSLKIGKKVGSKALNLLQRFDRAVFTPLMKIVTAPFKAMFFAAGTLKKYLNKIFYAAGALIKKVIAPVVTVTTQVMKYLAGKLKATFQPVADYLSRRKANLFSLIRGLNKVLLQPAIRAFIHSKTFARPVFRPIKNGSLLAYTACKSMVKFTRNRFPKLSKEKKEKKRSILYFGNPFKPMLKAIKGFFQIASKIAFKIKTAILSISRGLVWLFNLFKILPQKAMRCFVTVLRVLALILTKAAFVGHVVIAVLWMSSVYGFHLAKQISDPLVKQDPQDQT